MKKTIVYRLLLPILIASLGQYSFGAIFSTLSEIKQYADLYEENIDSDNQNWLNPDFSSFHRQHLPGFGSRLLQTVGIRRPIWTAHGFKKLLEQLTKKRELNSFAGRFILKLNPKPETKFIIWGDLHGAFHSLIRDLIALKNQGVINDDLKIIDQNYYFIFNGNVIDRSPYTLETLSLVMRLMEVNPKRVFYIRGKHEDKQMWQAFGLARELKIRARRVSREKIPLNPSVTRFFNTLPLALYLKGQNKKETINVVRISYYGRDIDELD